MRQICFSLIFILLGCAGESYGPYPMSGSTPYSYTDERILFQDFEAAAMPKNGDGTFYPIQNNFGGSGTSNQNSDDAFAGTKSAVFGLSSGKWNPLWNPYNFAGQNPNASPNRGFARQYAKEASRWKFNTYDRLRLWVKYPTCGGALQSSGRSTFQIGAFVKQVTNADNNNDDTGGARFTHYFNLANTGTWYQVILNMHPQTRWGDSNALEQGNRAHPTNESGYNYMDALTRFYIDDLGAITVPCSFRVDHLEFYRERYEEEDNFVYNVASTYVAGSNRILVTWSRHKDQNTVNHEVRYSFSDIHATGWNAATAAPNGLVTPLGSQSDNGMVYDESSLPLSGQSEVYIAIKPENSSRFTQVRIPLD